MVTHLHRSVSSPITTATQQLLSLFLTACSFSLPVALLPILVTSPQVLAQTIEDRRSEADRLFQQALRQNQAGQFQAALESWQQVLEIYRESGDRTGEISTLANIAGVYRGLGQYPQALDYFQQALTIAQALGDRGGEEVILIGIGVVHADLRQYLQALDYYQQALAIAQEIGDQTWKDLILSNIGAVYEDLGQHPQALDYYQQALSIAQETGDRAREEQILNNIEEVNRLPEGRSSQDLAQTQDARKAEADRLLQLGIQQRGTNQFQAALQSYQQALVIYREISDRQSETILLNIIGSLYRSTGQYSQAIEFHQQALTICRESGDRELEGIVLNNIGVDYDSQRQYPQALEYFQQALEIYRELGNQEEELTTLNNIGLAHYNLDQDSQALEFFQQGLEIARELGNRAGEADSLNYIGLVYEGLGQYPQALESFQQSLAIRREIGDRAGEGAALRDIGLVHMGLAQYPQALEFFQQGLEIARELGNRAGEADSLNYIGLVYVDLGQYPQALESFQQSLAIRREISDRVGEGAVLNNIGLVYRSLGQYPRALEFFQQGLEIAREGSYRAGESSALSNIGFSHQSLGQYPQALDSLQQALEIAREIGNRAGEGTVLNLIGLVYANQGQYPQAIEAYQQALSIAQEVGDGAGEGATLSNIGTVYADLRQYPQAIESYQQALSIHQKIGDRANEGTTLNNMGAAFFRSGQLQPAEIAFLDALTVFDELQQQDLSDADKISLFETRVYSYAMLQQVQIAQNKIEPALETSERGRARAFVSLLSQRLQGADATTNPPAPSVSDIQQNAREQNATLVQYSVINTVLGTPAIYIWVIAPTGEIAFRSVELNEENQQTLSGAINTAFTGSPVFRGDSTTLSNLLSDVLPSRSADRDVEVEHNPELATDRLQQLHQLLIEPIADLLPTHETDRIVFIPQGGLFLVPFAALQDANGDYLIEHHTISIAPSIQVLDLTRQQANPDRSLDNALVVGNPVMPTIWDTQSNTNIPLSPLPGAEQEAESIAQYLNTNAITGNAATETAITQQMPDASIIHLATHGLLEYGNPADSGVLDVPGAIALTRSNQDDGLLTSAEILEMQLQAELVVLSACDTGRGHITGDGVVGLSRALISAGVPSVVVSLWAVPDAPTAELMTEFYHQLQSNPDKAQALRQAMLITMQQHPDPINWAAFTLIGEAE